MPGRRAHTWIRRILVGGIACIPIFLAWNWGAHADRRIAREGSVDRNRQKTLHSPESKPVYGNPALLRHRYEKWKTSRTQPPHVLDMHIAPVRHQVGQSDTTTGFARLDLEARTLHVEMLAESSGPKDLWIADRSRSTHYVGRVSRTGTFELPLDEGFSFDQLVLTEPGQRPEEGLAIFVTPGLFERLLAAENGVDIFGPVANSTFQGGSQGGSGLAIFQGMVEAGAALFTTEEFAGNGRTCSSCHVPQNNYTIDKAYIDQLKLDAPQDPFFFMPPTDPNEAPFEVPALRDEGLIVVGKGDEPTDYVVRAVPHLLNSHRYVDRAFGQHAGYAHALGWDGEGSPNHAIGGHQGVGSLTDFAVGAVAQHFTTNLARVPGQHFRVPTGAELADLEAFLRSLGREEDNVNYGFNNTEVENGRVAFGLAGGNPYGCFVCHAGGGANEGDSGPNPSNRLGVEDFLWADTSNLSTLPDPEPGIGQPFDVGSKADGVTDGWFNTPPVIEAADTLPHFHNNATTTLRDTIRFYNSTYFLLHNSNLRGIPYPCDGGPNHPANCCAGSPPLCTDSDGDNINDSAQLSTSEINAMEKFLAAINMLDNLQTQAAPPIWAALRIAADAEVYDSAVVPLRVLGVANLEDIEEVFAATPISGSSVTAHVGNAIASLATVNGTNATSDQQALTSALGDMCLAWSELVSEPCPWICGDGTTNPVSGEQCDDGNSAGGDGCSAVCRLEGCGNGILDPGEDCDDGNTDDGDGCSSTCAEEPPTQSIVTNGNFADGSANWSFYSNGSATFQTGNGEAVIAIATVGTNTQLYQQPLTVKGATDYRLSFKGWSNDGSDVEIYLQKHGSPYTPYGLGATVPLTDTPMIHVVDFTTTAGDKTDARLRFWMDDGVASNGTAYHFDDVVIQELGSGSGTVCGNGTLETGEECDDGNTTGNDGCEADCAITECPAERSCGDSCSEGGWCEVDSGAASAAVDQGLTICRQESGSLLTCGGGDTVHTVTTPCTQCACCDEQPFPCVCPTECGDQIVLTCQSAGPPIVVNGDFSAGKPPWKFFSDGTATFSVSSEEAVIAVTGGGSNVQLYQYDIEVEGATHYRLRFRAESSNDANLDVYLHKHGSPYTNYGLSITNVDITSTNQEHVIEFTTTFGNKSDARLRFSFGPYDNGGPTYRIDDIVIEKLP